MSRDELLALAREAGWTLPDEPHYLDEKWVLERLYECLERFYALATARAAAAEREACAVTCETLRFTKEGPTWEAQYQRNVCAEAIRARDPGGLKLNAEQLRERIKDFPDDYVFHLTVPPPVVEQHWATTIVSVAQAKAFAACMEEAHFPEFGDVVQIPEDEWFALLKAFGLKQ